MSLKQEHRELVDARRRVGRSLDEKLYERGKVRKDIHSKQQRDPNDEQRERELSREIDALQKEERELTQRIKDLRDRNEELREKEEKVEKKIEDARKNEVVPSPGPDHWGGCDDILDNEVEPVAREAGFDPNSGKRDETYGNPGSDHHTSQVWASARDFPTVNNYDLRDKIARALGISGPISDFDPYYIERAGKTYRVQFIAGTHGTGPHLHCGIRLVG